MKLIFLDMDGVVNTIEDKYCVSLDLRMDILHGQDYHRCQFDPRLVFNFIRLLEFCKNNDIKIVISSTWRMGTTVEDWNNFFNKHFGRIAGYKLDDLVIDLTEVSNLDRGMQITADLININSILPGEEIITKYIIIDDNVDDITPYHDADKIVKVDPTKGLDNECLQKIFNKFKEGADE